MGCGKSCVSKELKAIFCDCELVETDSLIEGIEKCSISEIFSNKGESYFRKLEQTIIENLLKKDNQIISLGGGSLENNFDFDLANKNSIIIYLKASPNTLYERVKDDNNRPLLKCENPKEKLKELLSIREKNYNKADYIIEVDNLTINDVAKNIEGVIKNG